MADRKNILIVVLTLVVVILALVMIYGFIIQPAISGYSTQKQTQGAQIAANTILSQIVTQVQQNGYVQVPVGANQSLTLVPIQLCSRFVQPVQTTPTQTTTNQGTATTP